MRRIFLPLAAIIFIYLLSACAIGSMTDSRPTPPPPTTADLAGKWESEYGFFIIFDGEEGVFSGSNDEGAADDGTPFLGDRILREHGRTGRGGDPAVHS